MKRIPFLMLLLALSAPAVAQVYRWVDKDGKVHYSSTPPAEAVEEKQLKIKTPPPAPPAAAPSKTAAEKEMESKKEKQEKGKAQTEKEEEARRAKELCDNARQRLQSFQDAPRQFRYDSKGERVYMEDAEVARDTAKAREDIAKHCK